MSSRSLGLDWEKFLEDHWQKAPLRMAGAFSDFKDPINLEELMELACQPEADARLVVVEQEGTDYAVRYGPFEPEDFQTLPATGWTLLVRHVDKVHGNVAALLEPFRVLPDWRVDDVMVSYAVDGGNVGPHLDNFDVFLLQGMGRRRWQVDAGAGMERKHRNDSELGILEDFESTDEWVQEPGDLLYLPPGVAHHGVALEPSLTYSIGFRAPTSHELLAGWFEHRAAESGAETRFRDPPLKPGAKPGRLSKESLARIEELLATALPAKSEAVYRWFGRWITAVEAELEPAGPARPVSLESAQRGLSGGKNLIRHPACRISYLEQGDRAWLFVNGTEYSVSPDLAARVGNQLRLNYQDLRGALRNPEDAEVLLSLINAGCLNLESL